MAMAIAAVETDGYEHRVDRTRTRVPAGTRVRRPALHVTTAGRPRARRRPSAACRARRRRAASGAAVCGLLAALALPLQVLGGAPAPRPAAHAGAALTGSVVYVVQPGDTLWSVASRFDRGGNPRPLAEAIAAETGSDTVVPGERIAIP